MRYALRRLIHSAVLLVGVSILAFLISALAPGDFYTELQADPRVSAETLAALRAKNGLARPLPERYLLWLESVGRGEFGYSLAYHGPVGPLLAQRIPGTLVLTATATLVAWLLALPLGIWSAARRGAWPDLSLKVILSVLLATPELLLTIVFLALAVQSGCLPVGGMHSPGATGTADLVRHLVLPATVLTLGLLPVLIRHVRTAVAEAMGAPFALAARAHGISGRRLLVRHILPAALNPLISLFGFSLGTLLSASLLVEVIVGWPGLGPLFLDAIFARDYALVLGVVLVSTTFLIAGNLVADLLLYRADPRIRTT
jgi:peptide/nickel transport system permease protein